MSYSALNDAGDYPPITIIHIVATPTNPVMTTPVVTSKAICFIVVSQIKLCVKAHYSVYVHYLFYT